ncbi:MAG TPA: hypothetical protein VE053_04725 [Allosphingosinicella sp.]|nr:hypothetical protein [Allosphingosinicella sp.]
MAPSSWPGFQLERRTDTEYDALDRKTREWVSDGVTALAVTVDPREMANPRDASGRPNGNTATMLSTGSLPILRALSDVLHMHLMETRDALRSFRSITDSSNQEYY